MIKIIFGIIAGIVSGMGMGGGAILIVLLSTVLGVDQKISHASNLIFFIPTSLIASIVNIKHKRINFRISFYITAFGILGSLAGSLIATKISPDILKKIFSIFLFLIAIYESYTWYKKYIKRHTKNK